VHASPAEPRRAPLADPRALVAIVWLAAALAFLAFRLPFLDLPLERDEGEYAYIAQRWLAGGFVPYRDAFDQKPPGVFAAYAAAFALAGESVCGIRVFHLAWMAATTLLVGGLGARVAGPLAGAFAAFAFAALGASPALLGATANTEMFLLLPMTAALWACLRARQGGGLGICAAAGALAGATVLFKQVAALFVLFALGLVLWRRDVAGAPHAGPTRARVGLAFAAGVLLALAPAAIYFAAARSLGAFLDAALLHNLAYSTSVPLGQGLANLARELARQAGSFAPAWLLAGLALTTPRALDRARRRWLGGWLAVCGAALSVGLYFREHYFVLALPPLCVLAGAGASGVLRRVAGGRAAPSFAAGLALLAAIAAPPALASPWAWTETPVEISRRLYGRNPFPESPEVARLVREVCPPGESVLVLGSEPQILFLAGRRSATRYIITYPLAGGDARASLRQKEAIDELRAAPPGCVVIVRIPSSHGPGERPPRILFREVAKRVKDGHRLEALWLAEEDGPGYRALTGDAARAHGDRGARRRDGAAIALYRREG
jgi:hypothetical protein